MAIIENYKDAKALFDTCRSPTKGKPLPGGWRLFMRGKTYVVSASTWERGVGRVLIPLCEIAPNDVITFVMSLNDLLHNSNSIVLVLDKILPIMCQRVRKGVSRIGTGRKYSIDDDQPEYFQVLKFNLKTRTWINPQPDASTTIIPTKRKMWLRDLQRYKRGLKARAKVGALQGYIDKANDERGGARYYGRWRGLPPVGRAEMITTIVNSMKADEYPPEILEAFVQAIPTGYQRRAVTPEQVLETVDMVFTEHSVAFRREYGVFGKTLHRKK